MKISIARVNSAEAERLKNRMLEINKILLADRKANPKDRFTISEYNRYMGELKQISMKLNPEGGRMTKPMGRFD